MTKRGDGNTAGRSAKKPAVTSPTRACGDAAPGPNLPTASPQPDAATLAARYQALAAATAQIVWTTDAEGRAVEGCPPWSAFTGQSEEEAKGYGWLDAIHPDDREAVQRTWQRVAPTGEPVEMEYRLRRRDGDYRWFHARAVPVLAADGRICEWVGLCADVTEGREQEEEREALLRREREARAQLEAVLDVLPAALIIADAQGQLTHVNPAFWAIWGAHALASSVAEFPRYQGWHPDGRPIATDEWAMARALEHGETIHGQEVDILAFDGVRKTILNNAAPLVDAQGAITGGVVAFVDITERRSLERDLAERNAQLVAIFETMLDGVLVYDADGRLERMNHAARVLFGLDAAPGYTRGNLTERGKRLAIHDAEGNPVPEEAWPPVRILRGEALLDQTTVDYHVRNLAGEELDLNYSGAPIRDAKGLITGGVMVVRNVTERRRLEQEIGARAAELASIFETITDGVTVYGAHGEVKYLNRAYRAMLGLTDEELRRPFDARGQAIVPRRPETGEPLPHAEWPGARILGGETLTGAGSMDVLVRGHDGRELLLNCAGAPVYDQAGKVSGGVMVIRDVAERRRLERKTREALHALLEMAETMVGTADAANEDHTPQTARIARRLAELTSQVLDCQQLSIAAIDHDTGRMRPLTLFGFSEEQERVWWSGWSAETTVATRLGSDVAARMYADELVELDAQAPAHRGRLSPFQVRRLLLVPCVIGGRLIGGIALTYDRPPDADLVDRALARAIARLVGLVLERERLLGEREEARASALALRQANQRLDEFLGIAGHELRTPLTTILANTQIAQRRAAALVAEAEAKGYDNAPDVAALAGILARTGSAALRQNRLVSDLLDVSRIQAGKLALRTHSLDLAALVEDAVEEQRMAHSMRAISLAIPPTAVPIVADGDRIRQVVANYLTNALKYSGPTAPVDVWLEVETGADSAASSVRLSVRDRGPGIPAAERSHIWDRFHRVTGIEPQSGSGVGLGLGLYISREIIERHGGHVGVESAPGGGSIFWFTLPLAREQHGTRSLA